MQNIKWEMEIERIRADYEAALQDRGYVYPEEAAFIVADGDALAFVYNKYAIGWCQYRLTPAMQEERDALRKAAIGF